MRVTSSEAAKIVRSVLGRGLTFEQADQIIKAMVPVSAEPGMVVMREGERGPLLMCASIHPRYVNRLAHEYFASIHIKSYQYM